MTGLLRKCLCVFMLLSSLTGCDNHPWNDPYPLSEAKANIRYTSFSAVPKTLDPARSYSSDETTFTAQIYEPPLQYHFLKRPYTLEPLTATKMPKISYLDVSGKPLPDTSAANEVAFTQYEVELKPGIYYQPHPAFAKNAQGKYYYHHLNAADFKHISRLSDFPLTGSRELVAEDYVYQIKRLAEPGINSPIFGLMATKIVGLTEYADLLSKNLPPKGQWLDLRKFPLAGAQATDRYHYKIILKGKYPLFIYWLAMPFFAPIPWEGDLFYSQPGMIKRNITFNWSPIGTGPYTLSENNPNRRMVLTRNVLFHPEYYPSEGEPSDLASGYLNLAGKRLPFIDKVVFTLEKESIPRWNKFLQGYYDQSTISSDSFDQAIQIDSRGQPNLTKSMKNKGVYLQISVAQALTYLGFNMLDDIVGGYSERARKLRLAISIAINYEEFINLFLNGRGLAAQGPLPPGIFGYESGENGINPFVYDWSQTGAKRKSLNEAKRLLKEAGYPNGIDPKTNLPLILNYDFASTSGPDEKALLDWMREQFAKIGIQLNIRTTEYNRFQENVRLGHSQIFSWGWIADYPDPENFLFLLYGPNNKVYQGGENATNYQNKTFDLLFTEMKNMQNTPERQEIINKMLSIVRKDAPWVWGIYQESFVLSHVWNYPAKQNVMTANTLKYQKIDPVLRNKLRHQWNKGILWPLGILLFFMILISLPVIIRYQQKEKKSIKNAAK